MGSEIYRNQPDTQHIRTDWDILSVLAGRVMRGFYDPKLTAVMDAVVLSRRMGVKEEQLQNYLKLPAKEVAKLCHKLKEERFIANEQRTELTRVDGRRVTRAYFVVDWRSLLDVTKWKLWRIRKQLEKQMEKAKSNIGYRCPLCKATYTPLDAQSLIDMNTGVFRCKICSTEVEENDGTVAADGTIVSEDLLSRFMQQAGPILDILKVTDTMQLPEPVTDALNLPEADKSRLSHRVTGQLLLAPANVVSNDTDGKNQNSELHVVFENSEQEQQLLQEMKKVADAKKEQNTLPIWHQVSTVTGERMIPRDSRKRARENRTRITHLESLPLTPEDVSCLQAWYRLSSGTNASTPVSSRRPSEALEEQEDDDVFVEV